MNDYAQTHYTTLNFVQRLWLRMMIVYYDWEAKNETRLIKWYQGQIEFSENELVKTKTKRISFWNRANEIRARLSIAKRIS